jgi:hypothetical protein
MVRNSTTMPAVSAASMPYCMPLLIPKSVYTTLASATVRQVYPHLTLAGYVVVQYTRLRVEQVAGDRAFSAHETIAHARSSVGFVALHLIFGGCCKRTF